MMKCLKCRPRICEHMNKRCSLQQCLTNMTDTTINAAKTNYNSMCIKIPSCTPGFICNRTPKQHGWDGGNNVPCSLETLSPSTLFPSPIGPTTQPLLHQPFLESNSTKQALDVGQDLLAKPQVSSVDRMLMRCPILLSWRDETCTEMC